MHEDDELYLDVQGLSAEKLTEIVAKIAGGFILAWFSVNELMDELREYRTLRNQKRKVAYNGR